MVEQEEGYQTSGYWMEKVRHHQRGHTSRELLPCPFCGKEPKFPDSKDVYGTCYEGGCYDCGIPTISIQIIDCFDCPRDHVHDAWNEKEMQHGIEYIEVARKEAIAMWNRRVI